MICPAPGESGESMAAGVVRRRRRLEDGMPTELLTFAPGRWPGGSEYQQWMSWNAAVVEWAAQNLPNGAEDLPDRITRAASTPDQPWSEVVI